MVLLSLMYCLKEIMQLGEIITAGLYQVYFNPPSLAFRFLRVQVGSMSSVIKITCPSYSLYKIHKTSIDQKVLGKQKIFT